MAGAGSSQGVPGRARSSIGTMIGGSATIRSSPSTVPARLASTRVLSRERAFATILDSNVTTLIAGLALLAFGSGPIRAFAIVHCLGIVTSMFSAVMFSRGLVNFWYGRQKRLKSVSIGQVWKPGASVPAES